MIFTVTESEIEVLKHLQEAHKDSIFLVYSTSIAGCLPLDVFLANPATNAMEAMTTNQVLSGILTSPVIEPERFTKYIMLDCDTYVNDAQTVRLLRDCLMKYMVDEDYTVNFIMISHKVCVPQQLERLSEIVFYDLPNETQLKEQSDTVAQKLLLTGDKIPSDEVVSNLKGLTLFQVEQAYLQSHFLYNKVDLNFIRDFKKNAIAKSDLLSLLETDVTFDSVGGLDKLKQWMTMSYGGWTVEGQKYGLPLLKGVLLIGPPGGGKTLICKSLGHLWGLPVVEFDPSRVFSSRLGDSESNMRRVLHIVGNIAPCILALDEIEKSLAGLQSSSFSDSGVTARVIRSFLVWMQENQKPVFVVATANNIMALPPELISRFDEVFFVGLPNLRERMAIFSIHLKKLSRDPANYDLEALAKESVDLSGREIEQVLKESMYNCFSRKTELDTESIIDTLRKKTTIIRTMPEQISALLKWVGWDPDRKDGVRARFASTPENDDMIRIKSEIDSLIKDLEN